MTWKAEPPRAAAQAVPAEVMRITVSLAAVCAIGAVILAALFVATDRYQRAAALRAESRAIAELLQVGEGAAVTEVRQYLAPGGREVVYQSAGFGEAETAAAARALRVVFALDGRLLRRDSTAVGEAPRGAVPLGRVFRVIEDGRPAGFVVEGVARGYKERIRFLVGLTPAFEIAGVRVVQHQEDPGLGAEVATPWFQGQFLGREAARLPQLAVTRDPMPEDWRAALALLARTPLPVWRERHAALLARERTRPIYAVTGATISSKALTDGVRAAVDHFRRRWALVSPYLEGGA